MQKNHIGSLIDKNSLIDDGEGTIRVKGGLTLTDENVQRNGTRYDIKSLSIDEYDGRLFANHGDAMGGYTIESVIGKLVNVAKKGKKVVAEGIQYAIKESPKALFAYNMTKAGYLTDFSIGTMGPPPDDEGVYYNGSIFEVSQVGIGNHPNARINQVVTNSIEQAREFGLDTSELEEMLVKQNNINSKESNEMSDAKDNKEDKKQEATNEAPAATLSLEDIKGAVNEVVAPLQAELEEVKKNAFDKGVTEPEFKADKTAQNNGIVNAKNEFKSMDWESRTVNQIEAARRVLNTKGADVEAAKTLSTINEVNLDLLKGEGLVKNHMTIGDLGNYVISPEQLSEIQGFRSDFSDFVNMFSFRETLSTQTQWLKRSGDISMTAVDYDDSAITASGYLKPVSTYSATLETMTLEELAAVTPVANSATQFLAADILADVNAGYRTDYQRKLSQLIIARLEQAIEANGNSEAYTTTSDTNAVKDFANVVAAVAEQVGDGVMIMNHKSYWQMVSRATGAGISGPLAGLVTDGNQATIFGKKVILVPNELLPTLNTAETKSFTVNGVSVTVNHAVYYVNPTNWVGRVSGGLRYDLSTDAAYESGGTVYSAFQRNQLVLRGSFFRGGEVADQDLVSALHSAGNS